MSRYKSLVHQLLMAQSHSSNNSQIDLLRYWFVFVLALFFCLPTRKQGLHSFFLEHGKETYSGKRLSWGENTGALVGCSPWGRKELDTTEWLHFHALKKEMATHSSVLAWRIPGTRVPGGLPSMGSHRVRHDWSDLAAAASYHHSFFCGIGWLKYRPNQKNTKTSNTSGQE